MINYKYFLQFAANDKSQQCQPHSMQLQKEVKSNPKQPSCNPQEGHCEKDAKSKVAAKKWL